MVNPRVYMDLSVEDEPLGRVVFELFSDSVPKTVENFRSLATGERGVSAQSQVPLSYKGSIMHRCIPGFMVQGGDFTKKNGTGGESIYGGTFDDENFDTPLDAEGLLVMANRGPNTNGSQFFVTLRPCPHLNGKHVVFGRVVKGYELFEKIVSLPRDAKDRPLTPVIVSACGELVLKKKAAVPAGPAAVEERGRSTSRHSPSRTPSKSRSPSPGVKRRRRSSDSRSRSRSVSDASSRSRSRSPVPRKKKSKKHEKSSKKKKAKEDKEAAAKLPHQETEEELDARLEREENERIAEQKRLEVLRQKERLIAAAKRKEEAQGGVRFKGRGLMKFRDPESERDRGSR